MRAALPHDDADRARVIAGSDASSSGSRATRSVNSPEYAGMDSRIGCGIAGAVSGSAK